MTWFYVSTASELRVAIVAKQRALLTKPVTHHTANMCSGITVEVHLKNCNFEKLQFFTVDLCSLYFLQVKNCKFNTIFM